MNAPTNPRVHAFDMVAQIAMRLREAGIYKEVLDALDTAALKSWPKTPAAFVLPLAESPGDSLAPACTALQRVEMTIALQSLIAAPNDRLGSRATDQLAGVLAASRSCIAGFRPVDASEVIRFHSGRLLGIEDGRLEWRDEYRLIWWLKGDGGNPQKNSLPQS